jgi:hypothetical protein
MASCNGCGEALGVKKYRFNKMWRIGGYYCKPCMMRVGENWEKNGRVTIPMMPCDLCRTEFYFLKPAWQGTKERHFCGVCYRTAISGIVLGMIFTLVGTSAGEMNLVNLLFGAFTTAAGFMLLRRTLRNRRLIAGA